MSYEKAIRLLQEAGIKFHVHAHNPVLTIQDVEESLPFSKEKLLKTLVFRTRDGNWILVVLRGQDKLDYSKLAKALNVKRKELVMPLPEEIEVEMGYEVGGICPIPPNENSKVVFDIKIEKMGVVYCGIGRSDRSLEIQVQDLILISNASLHSISYEN